MKPCISQATTLMSPFEAGRDRRTVRSGWTAVELWLTKLEAFVEAHSVAEARRLLEINGAAPVAAAGQGGLLLSRGDRARGALGPLPPTAGVAPASWACRS